MPSPPSKPSRPLSTSSSSSNSASGSPSRPMESQTEVLYNTAVQSFVRRDHLKTHASLSRLIGNIRNSLCNGPRILWYDLSEGINVDAEKGEYEEWMIKSLKLSISAHASLYTDPPTPSTRRSSNSPSDLNSLLPPSPPHRVLQKLHQQCKDSYPDPIIPPQILSTLILAALKLQPTQDALSCIHDITEEWLGALPDEFMRGIGRRKLGGVEVGLNRRTDMGREGYLKVLELFVGEVLSREGEYEMARGILDGDTLLGSKRKEVLYRHLRAVQTRRETSQASTSNSGILPSPSGSLILPDSQTPTPRSRSNSTSSSEATARPTAVPSLPTISSTTNGSARGSQGGGSTIIPRRKPYRSGGKEQLRAGGGDGETDSESTLPSRIYVNPESENEPRRRQNDNVDFSTVIRKYLLGSLSPMFKLLPGSWKKAAYSLSNYQLASSALPLPIIAALFIFAVVRRRQRRRGVTVTGSSAVTPISGSTAVADLRTRLMAARRKGWWDWFLWYIKWWVVKFAGVWRMGTTITYV